MIEKLVPIHIVFQNAKDGSPDLIFVEVETPDGKGMCVGEWVEHVSGDRTYSALRLRVPAEDIEAVNE